MPARQVSFGRRLSRRTAPSSSVQQSGSTACGLRDPIRALLGIERGEQAAMAAQLRDAVADRRLTCCRCRPARRRRPYRRPSTPQVDGFDVRFRPARTGDAVVELLDAF
jgi:hypothetical protein